MRVLVLLQDATRIELHVRTGGEEAWVLVALVGQPPEQPGRSKCQGPYRRSHQAEDALRCAARRLLAQGFTVERAVHPIWAVQAQRLARFIREHGKVPTGVCQDDPDPHDPLL